MQKHGAELARIGDRESGIARGKHSGITNLTAAFSIERRPVEQDRTRLPGIELLTGAAVGSEHSKHARFGSNVFVSEEFGLFQTALGNDSIELRLQPR